MYLYHILCLLALVAATASIKCFQCQYVKSGESVYEEISDGYYSNCGNEDDQTFDEIPQIECPGHCYKVVTEDADSEVLCVSRGCYNTSAASADDCPKTAENYGMQCGVPESLNYVNGDRYCCDSDECNGGSVAVSSLLTSLLLVLLTLV